MYVIIGDYRSHQYSCYLVCDSVHPDKTIFQKNISFHGILLDALFEPGNADWQVVYQLMTEGIASGVVHPLKTTRFDKHDVEGVFRFMAQGKHIGKVVIQVSELSKKLGKSCHNEKKMQLTQECFNNVVITLI